MSLGNIGKALAGQAMEATKKNVIDAIVGPEPAKPEAAAAPAGPESIGGTVLGQIQAMQRPLKDDQEFAFFSHPGSESLRVLEFFAPSLHVFVLSGVDSDHNVPRVVIPADKAQLVCKIRKVAADARPVRINILSPRPKT